jgi:glycosyltransferase 2 family protein
MRNTLLNGLKFLFFLSIGLGILYFVFQKQQVAYQQECQLKHIASEDCSLWRKILDDFLHINYFWIAATLACFAFSNFSRAKRWLMLIRPLGYKPSLGNAFWTINLGYFANLGLPRIGEVVRAGSMASAEKIPVEKLLGTIVVDRTIDVLSLLIAVGLAFCLEFNTLWTYLNANMAKGSLFQNPIVQVLLAMGLVALVFFLLFRKKILALGFVKKIIEKALGFWQGIKAIKDVEQPFWFFIHSLNIWLMYYLMAYFCFFAYAPTAHLGTMAALMVFVFGAFGVLIPSPGGMGTYHALVIAALSLYNIKGDEAFSFANIFFFSVNIFFCIVLGVIALIWLGNRKKNNI